MAEPVGQQGRTGERGAILLLLSIALTMSVTSSLLLYMNRGAMHWQRPNQDLQAMAATREALLAWAVVYGALPCPDQDGDGAEESGCPTLVGRVPWKTLGLALEGRETEALTNGNQADKLWFAKISGTQGMIFNPGDPIAEEDQVRATLAEQQDDANYIENLATDGSGNLVFPNSGIVNPILECNDAKFEEYAKNGSTTRCNDRWLAVDGDAYIDVMSPEMLKDAKKCLYDYNIAKVGYPNPVDVAGTSDYFGRISDIDFSASGVTSCVTFQSAWNEEWRNYLFLQVAAGWAEGEPLDCATGGNCLTVNGTGANHAVVISAGSALDSQTRDAALTITDQDSLIDYLEDDNATSYLNRNFKSATSSSTFNDQLACLDGVTDDTESTLCP